MLLLLLLLLLGSHLGCSAQRAGVAHVRTDEQLYSALTGKSETIVLHNDVAMGQEFAQFEGSPLSITRNVTIIGSAGNTSDVDAMPVIDLMHWPGILHICSTCSFVFKWVSLAHENQVGTGLGMSVFRGGPGSRLERIGGVGLRTACPQTVPTVLLLNQSQRSPLFPSPPGGQQLAGITNFTYRGKLYKDMLLIGDLSGHIPVQQLTNSAFMGGYSIRRRNATRLCEYIVSGQCLQRKLPEECIAELMANSTMHTADEAAASNARTVAIAVPVAVGGVLVLVGVAAALLWRQRRRQQQTAPTAPNTGKPSLGPDSLASQHDIEAAGDQGTKPDEAAWSSADSKKQHGSANNIGLMQPAAVSFGPGHLLWSSSAPSTPWEGRDDIELGVLLGAGSFARVYRGRWCGLDVAVKVIQHDMESAKDVANELQLMLNLCHPNIVRAYHCVTKQLVMQQPGSPSAQQTPRAAASGTSSGAGLVGTDPQQLGSAEWQPPASTAAPAPASDGTPAAAALPTSTLSSSRHLQDLDPASPPANKRRSWQLAAPGAAGSAATGADGAFPFDAPVSSLQGLTGHLSPAATGSQPSTISSSAASVTSGISSNHAWQLLQAGGSAQFPPLELGSCSAGLSGGGGGASSTSGSGRGMGLVADKPAVLCESWLVTELCDRGTLARQASEWQPESNEQDMLRLLHLLRDVVCGLKLLKAQHVVHADLNAHNVLVASSPVTRHGFVAKVADLGLSRVLKQHATHRTTHTVGMLTHQPPELLRDGKMSPAGDIYSFGIMMVEVFTRHVAYPRMRYGQIYHQVVVLGVRPAVPADMPEDYELLMKRCWSAEPSDRPSVDMLLDCLDLMIEDRQEQPQLEQQQLC